MKRLVCLCAACGAGKSTVRQYLSEKCLPENYIAVDTDETGLNWWDYANTDEPDRYTSDSLKIASEMAGKKNLLFASCLFPAKLYDNIAVPEDITETYIIGMVCSDDELEKRLKERDPARMCSDSAFIAAQIEYNNWFRRMSNRLPLFIDNSSQTVGQTAEIIAEFLKKLDG